MTDEPHERATRDELAEEAAAWTDGRLTPEGWRDAPEAVPRAAESKAISIRIPVTMLQLLRGFAKREGIGYQVLIKRWLNDRLRAERERLRGQPRPRLRVIRLAGSFPQQDLPGAPYRTGTEG